MSRIDEIVKQQAEHSALFDSHDSYKIVQRSEIRKMLNSIDYLLSQLKDGGAEEMPTLPFVCTDCGVQQHADGICANCTSRSLRATAPTETSARCGECAYGYYINGACNCCGSDQEENCVLPASTEVACPDCVEGKINVGCAIDKPLISVDCGRCKGTGRIPADSAPPVAQPEVDRVVKETGEFAEKCYVEQSRQQAEIARLKGEVERLQKEIADYEQTDLVPRSRWEATNNDWLEAREQFKQLAERAAMEIERLQKEQ